MKNKLIITLITGCIVNASMRADDWSMGYEGARADSNIIGPAASPAASSFAALSADNTSPAPVAPKSKDTGKAKGKGSKNKSTGHTTGSHSHSTANKNKK